MFHASRQLLLATASLLTIGSMLHAADEIPDRSFAVDAEFLRQHVEVVELGAKEDGPRVAVVPAYQGRVMTSTAGGPAGTSYGWINYEHIASGTNSPHINVYGGEERFWLGPEGGQFSIFFPPGAKFALDDWQTPAVIDAERFAIVDQDDTTVDFRHEGRVSNYANAEFRFRVDRKIQLLSTGEAASSLGQDIGELRMVGYRSTNRLTNIGENDWTKDNGLLSIWILGMYRPGPRTTVAIPFRPGDDAERGPVVNDAYFGKPPAERLKIGDGVLYFSGDGQFRSKIGLSPRRARDVCGSWDAERGVLTILKYNQPAADVTDYVNSMWEVQDEPFAGDVVNSYNDGPPTPGAQPLGPFYELETSSPALALAAGATGAHIQETYHFEGDRDQLDALALALLGVSLDEIEAALP
jgi:hypothetical protein